MLSMLLGRPLAAIGGLLVLVLLSRKLPAVDYGLYFSVWAIAEIVILASNVGLIHAVYRYVSADECLAGRITPQGPVARLVGWRLLSLLPCGLALALAPQLTGLLGTQLAPATVGWLALIVMGEGMARFFEAVFDSMLCQGRSQLTLISRTVLRLLGYGWVLSHGSLQLQQVLLIEVAATTGGALLGLLLLLSLYRGAPAAVAQPAPASPPLAVMAAFALPAYLAQVLTLTYGPDALKLILSATAGPAALALFGFAYSLAAVVQRYMPANLLAGVFRPVFVAAAKKDDADQVLSHLIGLSIKVNWLVVLPVLCFLWSGGSGMLAMISGGNYPHAGPIVSAVVLALLLIAVHLTLSMYCLALAISWPVLWATAASALSLPVAFLLARAYGAMGICQVFLLSELIWCTVCYTLVKRHSGGALQLHWQGLGKLLAAAAAALALAELLRLGQVSWLWLAPGSTLLFVALALVLMPFSPRERGWLLSILPGVKFLKKFQIVDESKQTIA